MNRPDTYGKERRRARCARPDRVFLGEFGFHESFPELPGGLGISRAITANRRVIST
jgi:hypothetical protein